jgi:HlyD family secretion protein
MKMKLKLHNKRYKGFLLILVVLVVVGAATGYSLLNSRSNPEDYLTARVEKGTLRNTVSATGTLQAVTTVQVGSQVSGTISALYADFNSVVRKGQIIAQLDPALFQAQVASARANLEQARASLADAQARVLAAKAAVETQRAGVSSAAANLAALKAQRDDAETVLRRQEKLVASGLVAQQELESVRANFKAAEARYNQAAAQLDQARVSEQSAISAGLAQAQAQVLQATAQVQQAEAALRLAEVNLSHTTITSPIDGVVVSRNVDVGQTVAASLSAPTLFTIANDLTQMQVIANIDQADIGVINSSTRVNFTVDAFPGEIFQGTINQIRLNPQNVQNVVTYNVVVDVKNPELKLKPGMTANLTFTIAERVGVLKVPNAAFRFSPPEMTPEKLRQMLESQPGNEFGKANKEENRQQRDRSSGGAKAEATASSAERKEEKLSGARGIGFAPPSAAVLEGQARLVWVLGPDKKPHPRRIKVGITDGTATEVVQGDLREGEILVVGQNLAAESRPQNRQTPPGFSGLPGTRGGVRR